jgi:hypothetical protein
MSNLDKLPLEIINFIYTFLPIRDKNFTIVVDELKLYFDNFILSENIIRNRDIKYRYGIEIAIYEDRVIQTYRRELYKLDIQKYMKAMRLQDLDCKFDNENYIDFLEFFMDKIQSKILKRVNFIKERCMNEMYNFVASDVSHADLMQSLKKSIDCRMGFVYDSWYGEPPYYHRNIVNEIEFRNKHNKPYSRFPFADSDDESDYVFAESDDESDED